MLPALAPRRHRCESVGLDVDFDLAAASPLLVPMSKRAKKQIQFPVTSSEELDSWIDKSDKILVGAWKQLQSLSS